MGEKLIDCYLVELGHWVDYKSKVFERNIYTPEVLYRKILTDKSINCGAFKTVYSYNTTDIDNSYLVGDFYLDFDDKEDFEKVRRDALETINMLIAIFGISKDDLDIYFSGNKGIHIYLDKEIFGVVPHKKLNIVYKHIARYLRDRTNHKTIDLKVYDNKRLFRIPNTLHEKSNLYKVNIDYDELKNLPSEDIYEIAKRPRKVITKEHTTNERASQMYLKFLQVAIQEYNDSLIFKHNGETKAIDFIPKCVTHILEVGPINGQRNHTVAALTSFYKQSGYNYQDILQKVIEWNSGALSLAEIKQTVASIYNSDVRYGCSTFKDLSICDSNCRFKKGKSNDKPKYI